MFFKKSKQDSKPQKCSACGGTGQAVRTSLKLQFGAKRITKPKCAVCNGTGRMDAKSK
jgi:DnaJ-class molecular chaperone